MGNKDEIAKKTNDKKKGYICKKNKDVTEEDEIQKKKYNMEKIKGTVHRLGARSHREEER